MSRTWDYLQLSVPTELPSKCEVSLAASVTYLGEPKIEDGNLIFTVGPVHGNNAVTKIVHFCRDEDPVPPGEHQARATFPIGDQQVKVYIEQPKAA